mmetsp:Transcript_33878/g.28627  ORF Transcript_33878/g.28627 Transcript_33878/m.28627 type:complete len:163 (+) Transcript_33878:416-904(+)
MINSQLTNKKDALIIAQNLREAINQNFKHLEIDIDGLYRKLLLYKKKKYAALKEEINTDTLTEEIKGLDIVRRDWSTVAKKIGKVVINIILKGDSIDQIIELLDKYFHLVKDNLENKQELKLKEFVITEKLNKDLDSYSSDLHSPHIVVARELKRLNKLNSN